jgi:hypothetical protein
LDVHQFQSVLHNNGFDAVLEFLGYVPVHHRGPPSPSDRNRLRTPQRGNPAKKKRTLVRFSGFNSPSFSTRWESTQSRIPEKHSTYTGLPPGSRHSSIAHGSPAPACVNSPLAQPAAELGDHDDFSVRFIDLNLILVSLLLTSLLLYFSNLVLLLLFFSNSSLFLCFGFSHRLPPASTGFSHPLAQNARMAQFPARDALKRNRMTNLGHSHRKAPQSK